jgi:hypothetical protein
MIVRVLTGLLARFADGLGQYSNVARIPRIFEYFLGIDLELLRHVLAWTARRQTHGMRAPKEFSSRLERIGADLRL